MTEELVEKVGRVLCGEFDEDWSDQGCRESWQSAARAVIPVVLEAAAKVAEGRASHHEYVKRAVDGEWEAGSPYDRGAVKASQDIAKAIRQMGSI